MQSEENSAFVFFTYSPPTGIESGNTMHQLPVKEKAEPISAQGAEIAPNASHQMCLLFIGIVILSVVPVDGDFRNGHQVVLTKFFQRGGETWYEMMDSNQGPQQRLYLSAKELSRYKKKMA